MASAGEDRAVELAERCAADDSNWGSETVLQRCEQEGLPYLLRLRQTAKVKQALERAMSIVTGPIPAMAGGAGREAALQFDGLEPVTPGDPCCVGAWEQAELTDRAGKRMY